MAYLAQGQEACFVPADCAKSHDFSSCPWLLYSCMTAILLGLWQSCQKVDEQLTKIESNFDVFSVLDWLDDVELVGDGACYWSFSGFV